MSSSSMGRPSPTARGHASGRPTREVTTGVRSVTNVLQSPPLRYPPARHETGDHKPPQRGRGCPSPRRSAVPETMTLLRNFDLFLLAVALGLFAVAGLPMLGWVTGAGIWALWRGIEWWTDRKLRDEHEPRRLAGIAAGSLIG